MCCNIFLSCLYQHQTSSEKTYINLYMKTKAEMTKHPFRLQGVGGLFFSILKYLRLEIESELMR